MDHEAVRLTSPAPLEDRLKRFNAIYPAAFLAGAIIGILFHATWYTMGLFCLIPAWLIKSLIATKLVLALQSIHFEMPYSLTGRDLAGRITLSLTQLGMTVTVDDAAAVITYRSMQYYIRNNSGGSFYVIFGPTVGSTLLMGHRYITQYKKAIVAIGIIVYVIQGTMDMHPAESNRETL